jgi:ATP-dependent protease Clp ATPase subunit
MEECMLDVMYELPSDEHATECVINEQVSPRASIRSSSMKTLKPKKSPDYADE